MVVDELTPETLVPVVVPEIEKAEGARGSASPQAPRRAGAASSHAAGPGHAAAAAVDALLRRHGPQRRSQGRRRRAAARGAATRTSGAAAAHVDARRELRRAVWTAPPGLPTPVHKGTALAAARGSGDAGCAGAHEHRLGPAPSAGAAPRTAERRRGRRRRRAPRRPASRPRLLPRSACRGAIRGRPAPPVTGAVAAPARAPPRQPSRQAAAPTLLNSRSLTGFPSADRRLFDLRSGAAASAGGRAAAAGRSAGVASPRDAGASGGEDLAR